MISYSTGSSGSGADVEKVRRALDLAQAKRPDLLIDGPMQYDAASVASVGLQKAPASLVAGRANVFIFPDLNTGNTTYKAVQRSAHVVSIGPMLLGSAQAGERPLTRRAGGRYRLHNRVDRRSGATRGLRPERLRTPVFGGVTARCPSHRRGIALGRRRCFCDTRRRHHLRAHWRSRAARAQSSPQGRPRRLRGHPTRPPSASRGRLSSGAIRAPRSRRGRRRGL